MGRRGEQEKEHATEQVREESSCVGRIKDLAYA